MAVRGRFTRFSTGPPIHVHPGLSAQQAADNPELAKKIAAEQETLDGLRARIDGFPKKEGTMYCARLHTSTVHACTCATQAVRPVCAPYPCAQLSARRKRKSPRCLLRR